MNETMYVVLEMETDDEGLIYADQIGFLPVYRTLEDLREDYPDADYACIREGRMIAREPNV